MNPKRNWVLHIYEPKKALQAKINSHLVTLNFNNQMQTTIIETAMTPVNQSSTIEVNY